MTRNEAIELLKDSKVFVKDKSAEIQQIAFELGFQWNGNDMPAVPLNEDMPFLYFESNMTITCGLSTRNFYSNRRYTELTPETILNITIGDEPPYRPFSDYQECWNEMLNHKPFGWVQHDKLGQMDTVTCLGMSKQYDVHTSFFPYTFAEAFNELKFADGAPFGTKVN